jgi:hypothetical protein
LDEDIEHVAVLVDSASKVMQLAANAHEHLVHESLVARPGPTSLQRIGKLPAEAYALPAEVLIADHHAAGGQDRLDVTQAETEAVVKPDRMPSGLGGKRKPRQG